MKKLIYSIFSIICISAFADNLVEALKLNGSSKEEMNYTCAPAPAPPPPAQHSSVEGLPPLPLPVVPLRRTEKKNPPRPPVLIAKIMTANRSDWATNPADLENLLKWMTKTLNVSFSDTVIPDGNIPADAKSIPILYRTGHEAFSFTAEQRVKLREYILNGGTLVFDACCGRQAFAASALKEMETLIPERLPYILPSDHPLFNSYFNIKEVKFRSAAVSAGAKDAGVIGIDIGCRTAVFLFRWDVSCGWDEQPDTERHHCMGYTIETAKLLGANLLSYITSEHSTAVPMSHALEFKDANALKSDKLIIAQAKYDGQWRCRDSALPMLLAVFNSKTKIPVKYESEEVSLSSPKLFELPVIYITGHKAFAFTEAERAAIRRYVDQGGFILAESCCGRIGFTLSFQHEMATIFKDSAFGKLQLSHDIYRFPNVIKDIQPLPALAAKLNTRGRIPPELYGLEKDGHIAVVFSPYGLSCGWEMAQCPYCRGIHSKDAIVLGINILTYSLMH